ncbi:TetR/AcrR family transcriptional regulator [Amycolatopsis sp. NPDC054798]
MPTTSERGGPQTRARILEVANRLFLERGYEAVTVAEVAREAGVSSVTVFNHFARKEDLFLDRAADVANLLRTAVRDRRPDADGENCPGRHFRG